jgi:serine protease Do
MTYRAPCLATPSLARIICLILASGAAAILPACSLDQPHTGPTTPPPASASTANPATGAASPDSPEKLREEMRAVVTGARDKVFPALVNISVVTVNYFSGKETKGGAVGSGTIITPDGYILTNQHVTDSGKKFRVTLADRRELPATIVGEDPLTDLAILKIAPDQIKGEKLPFAEFGDSDKLVVGDYVMAMGSPLALSRSVTLGIVSNNERVFTSGMSGDEVEEMELDAGRTGVFTAWIQHDAAINHGNSGGPLVNLWGQVVGVNELGGNQMAFAIPANLAKDVAHQLIEHGEVVRSSIGIALKPIKRSEFKEGVFVNSVTKDSPADKAGIKAGDLITAMDGKPVTVRFVEEVPRFIRAVAARPVGSPIALTYKRDGTDHTTTVTTEKLLKERGEQAALRTWGISLSQITEKMARDRQLDSTDGAIVSGMRRGGPADLAEPSMSGGDVIRAIEGQPVKTLKEAVEAYKTIMSKDPIPEFVLIGFDRAGKNQVTLIKPRPDKREDPPREIPKSWIGAATQPVLKDLAKELGNPDALGFRVTRVYPGTLAASSDLKVGDIITGLNGDKLTPRGMQDGGMFQRKVRQLSTTTEPATLTVIRGDKTVEVKVPLERTRIGTDEALKEENKDFELTVRELTFFDRDDEHWGEEVTGVLVENVEHAGWAGMAGVGEGDLIQKINSYEIKDIPGFRKAMDAIAKAQPDRVTFEVLRRNRTYFMFAEPEWKPQVPTDKTPEQQAKDAAKPDPKPEAKPDTKPAAK